MTGHTQPRRTRGRTKSIATLAGAAGAALAVGLLAAPAAHAAGSRTVPAAGAAHQRPAAVAMIAGRKVDRLTVGGTSWDVYLGKLVTRNAAGKVTRTQTVYSLVDVAGTAPAGTEIKALAHALVQRHDLPMAKPAGMAKHH